MFLNVYKQTFQISHVRITQKAKRCFNMKPSTSYFHIKRMILADFQICISVTLSSLPNCKRLREKEKKLNWKRKQSFLRDMSSFIRSFAHLLKTLSPWSMRSFLPYVFQIIELPSACLQDCFVLLIDFICAFQHVAGAILPRNV